MLVMIQLVIFISLCQYNCKFGYTSYDVSLFIVICPISCIIICLLIVHAVHDMRSSGSGDCEMPVAIGWLW